MVTHEFLNWKWDPYRLNNNIRTLFTDCDVISIVNPTRFSLTLHLRNWLKLLREYFKCNCWESDSKFAIFLSSDQCNQSHSNFFLFLKDIETHLFTIGTNENTQIRFLVASIHHYRNSPNNGDFHFWEPQYVHII